MPAINKVSTLETVTETWIRMWLLSLPPGKSKHSLNQMKSYIIKQLNSNIRQKLVTGICELHIFALDINSKCRLLELLGDNTITSIDLTKSGHIFVDEVFHLYRVLTMSNFNNLLKLGIICNVRSRIDKKYIEEVNNMIYKSLSQMKYLRWITLTGLGESLFLQKLGSSCPNLEYLDVKDSLLVNDASVVSLLFKNPEEIANLSYDELIKYTGPKNECCPHLTYLGISGTDVGFLGILISLLNLPNLVSFGGYTDESSVSDVLSYFISKNIEVGPLKLSELWNDNLSVNQTLNLENLCPNMYSLHTNVKSLYSFYYLNNFFITSLTLDCDFKNVECELSDFLSNNGSFITYLCLTQNINIMMDLNMLIKCLPLLKEITLPLHLVDIVDDTKKWLHLEKSIIFINSIHTLKVFLMHSPVLSYLRITFNPDLYSQETQDSLDDDFIIDVLSNGALKQLEYFSMEDCGIGITGLEAILLSCTKLKYLEKLYYWKHVKNNDLSKLKKKIKSLNWDLKVVLKEKYCDMTLSCD